jgi:hypothetical protein
MITSIKQKVVSYANEAKWLDKKYVKMKTRLTQVKEA